MIAAVMDAGVELAADEQDELYKLLEDRVQSLLQAQTSHVAAAWGADGAGFDAAVQALNAQEHLREVANALSPGGAGPNKLRRSVIAAGLENGMRALPGQAAAYLAAIYQRTVAFALLQQDPAIRRVKSQLASRRIAYLDANVLMAAMFQAHNDHELGLQVLEISNALGAELRVTTFTLEELSARISEASRWMNKYRGRNDLYGVVDDVVVRSYAQAARDARGLKWGAFIGNFDPAPPWLSEHRISIETEGVPETERDSRLPEACAEISRNRRHASSLVVMTDALNLLHVVRGRKLVSEDEMGNVVWFVTLDRSLARAERVLIQRGVFTSGASRLAQTWVDLLSPCLPPDETKLSGYVAHLVQSEFGLLAQDPMFVKKEFLLTLTESRFDISEVLGASPDRARQVLTRLQEYEELEALLQDPQPRESDQWSQQLEGIVSRALADVDRSEGQRAELEQHRLARLQAEQRAADERQARLQSVRELAIARSAVEEAAAAAEAARGAAERALEAVQLVQGDRDAIAAELRALRLAPWWRRIMPRAESP